MWYIHTQWNTIPHKKVNPAILTTWMALEGIMLSETGQTEKDKYCMIPFTYGIQETKQNSRPPPPPPPNPKLEKEVRFVAIGGREWGGVGVTGLR